MVSSRILIGLYYVLFWLWIVCYWCVFFGGGGVELVFNYFVPSASFFFLLYFCLCFIWFEIKKYIYNKSKSSQNENQIANIFNWFYKGAGGVWQSLKLDGYIDLRNEANIVSPKSIGSPRISLIDCYFQTWPSVWCVPYCILIWCVPYCILIQRS